MRRLLLERLRMRRALRPEEMLRSVTVNGGRRRSASAGRQTGARRDHGQVASHHASVTQLRVRRCHSRGSACSEFSGSHGRERVPDVRIVDVRQVRVPGACMQRRDPAVAIERAKSVEADDAEASAISAPPREEGVTRPNRQPAKAAPSSPTKTEAPSPTAAESEERNISRRPERTVKPAPHRSRPPRPRAAIPHPATVVIRRPSPRFKADPGPAVVRLPHPVAVAVWSPAIGLIRHPDIAVVWGVLPSSVGIQIFRANVILVGMLPRSRFVNHAIAFDVPADPSRRVRERG